MNGLYLAGTGRCVPSRLVSNDSLAQQVDTSDEWISTRTGIRQRYFCAPDETNTALAAQAAQLAMQNAAVSTKDIGVCIAATFTADYAMPSLACSVHGALGLAHACPAFDVNAACTGFIAALETARSLLAGGMVSAPYALVIGSEVISRVLDFSDRNTCVLFGDGAGAAVVRLSDSHPYTCRMGAHGNISLLHAGGCACDDRFVHMEGKAVFRFACETVPECIRQVLCAADTTLDQIDHIVCHQANGRILDAVARRLGCAPEKFYKNMQRYANTSAASIPIALDEMRTQGLLVRGQRIILTGFGAGLTWGGSLLTY